MMASWPQLLILVAVIVLLFGTKKLRNLGSDLGTSIKGFKKAMSDDDTKKVADKQDADFPPASNANKTNSVESGTDSKKE